VIIYRDMSPQNIIASYEGEVKILDFGIAKAASKISKTEAGVLKGKFSYMSPEQASGRSIDQSTDVYACGVILHELLTSDRLFRAKTDLETLERVKEGHVDPPSQKNSLVPSDLDAIVLKALAKRQADRYTSASEMLNDLSQLTATHQFRYNSQDLAGFMKSLFSSTISEERERLIEHLKQIPPVISPSDQIMNARTNISFKRMPPIEDEKLPSEPKKKEEFTSTASKRLSPSKLPSAKVILSVALILIAGFYFLKMPNPPQKETTPTEQPTSKGQEPSALPMISQIPIIEITPTPNDMPRVDQVFGEVSPPPPEDIPMTKKSSPTPTPSPVEVKRTPRPTLRPKAFGSIDMMAPPEGFAELSIDGKPYGSVPGPKARDIRLEQGFHEFKCTTSKKSYSGRIEILPHESQIIRCEDLVVKD
jgi:serine/threonine protein kinase